MHLLAAQAGAAQQEGEAIDLGQTPADILFLSAADSELMMLASAADRAGTENLRLANILRLSHNLSVDLWIDKTARHAKLIVVRLLGGPAYWQYGVDELTALSLTGTKVAFLPGDPTPDPILRDRSTVSPEDWSRLHALFTAGGPDNADALLQTFVRMATPLPASPTRGEAPIQFVAPPSPSPPADTSPLVGEVGRGDAEPLAPRPFPRFGHYHPTTGLTLDRPTALSLPSPLRGGAGGGGSLASAIIPILFYRAALEGAGTATIDAIIVELEAQGLTPLPLVISTLKEGACISFVQAAFAAHPPAVILNLTGFALGLDGIDPVQNPFAGIDVPVIQLVQSGRPEAQWAADIQGLTAKDLAMQVVLPELDGRIGGLIVGHKADAIWHPRTQCPLSSYAPDHAGIGRAVTLAKNWTRLRSTPRADRKVAIVLANYPTRDGRLANGVGYDAPQSTVEILRALDTAGYGLAGEASARRRSFTNRRQAKRIDRARSLRNGATPPERHLWQLLHDFIERGYRFRRQVPIGQYFADFACHHPKLVIELDGNTHFGAEAVAFDATRDAFLRTAGYQVLRFTNHEVITNRDGVWQVIDNALRKLPTPAPSPSPQGGGGRRSRASAALLNHPPAVLPSPLRGGVGGGGYPSTGNDLIDLLQSGPTNAHPDRGTGIAFPLARYRELFKALPEKIRTEVTTRWGDPAADPFVRHAPPSPLRGGAGGGGYPSTGNDLIDLLQSGPTNAHPDRGTGMAFPLARYRELFKALPEKIRTEVTTRWGDPAADPFVRHAPPSPLRGGAGGGGSDAGSDAAFHLPALHFGNVVVLLQPARGYHLDETASYHDPDLVPPHGYLAAYLWLRHEFGAHAVIHNGKHGNLEWLPGKATALDAASYPAALWAELPHLYPFIVNDPGEGTQAKRRTGAVIIDHLVPPLTRAETYGPLKDLEALLDEYYAASGMDRRRLKSLQQAILDYTRDTRLDRDIGLGPDDTDNLRRIDTFLCDLKEAQIRDGLHIFGQSPTGRIERDLAIAIARVPRDDTPAGASLIRALADDLKLGFDPLTADLGAPWSGPSPLPASPTRGEVPSGGRGKSVPNTRSTPPPSVGEAGRGVPRSLGDVVEYLEQLAADLLDGSLQTPGPATAAVLDTIHHIIIPRLRASGPNEIAALLDGLDGKFVSPGSSGAPSRGRLDVLPTGRNFYSVDIRAVPTPTAWELGQKSAENLLVRHFQDHGTPLRSLALSVWGTSNMRTGGDDIAQALAFIGARPTWDPGSLRIAGYEIVPLARLGRPRVDVTLRISGFFRDAFPAQIALFDRACRAIGALDEPEDDNPIAARMRIDALGLMKAGATEAEAALRAGHRIFGSKPGAYGAGLQGLMDSGAWETKANLAEAFLNWGQYAYGAQAAGIPERERFAARLSDIEAVVHNQDNREHDLLDSDDYYQFEGGLVASAEVLTGRRPTAWHNDHSRPERPLARTLEEEISRVMRSRVVNPKWIDGVKRHGYKGAFEIIATVDYMFAFAATTGAVKTHHFDLAFEAFVEDAATRDFITANNRFGYDELIAKFNDARERGFWTPRSNSAHALLAGVIS
jgi:cobaltochelatase CobN